MRITLLVHNVAVAGRGIHRHRGLMWPQKVRRCITGGSHRHTQQRQCEEGIHRLEVGCTPEGSLGVMSDTHPRRRAVRPPPRFADEHLDSDKKLLIAVQNSLVDAVRRGRGECNQWRAPVLFAQCVPSPARRCVYPRPPAYTLEWGRAGRHTLRPSDCIPPLSPFLIRYPSPCPLPPLPPGAPRGPLRAQRSVDVPSHSGGVAGPGEVPGARGGGGAGTRHHQDRAAARLGPPPAQLQQESEIRDETPAH